MAARKKRTPRITIGESDVLDQVKRAVAKILKSDYAEFRIPLHTDKEIEGALDGVGRALVQAFVKASPKLFDGGSRTPRASKGRSAGTSNPALDMTPRYAPAKVSLGPHGEHPVIGATYYPPGKHKNISPIKSDMGAVVLVTARGLRWYGVDHAYINSQLRMVVVGTDPRDEVRMGWKTVPSRFRDMGGTNLAHREIASLGQAHGRGKRGKAQGSDFAVGPGVYRRIEVRLNKVAPGEYTITFKKWVAGAGRNAENVGKISKSFTGTARDAIAYANKIGAEAASEYPNYLVEVVTS